jgi:uncharacterized protein (DUF924 family)
MSIRTAAELLEFWFSETSRAQWFEKSAAFDGGIRDRFGETARAAAAGGLNHWGETPPGALALVIALDQFPRNLHRDSPRAFAADAKARAVADEAIARGFDREMPLDRRFFFYLPFEHSESPADQRRSIALFQGWVDGHDATGRDRAMKLMPYVHRHAEIIERFGRFPHRNEALGRESTPAEVEFLRQPNSSF